jgi:tRNA(fMet)-specific endonuclease VapC
MFASDVMRWILDTDHVSLVLRKNPIVIDRLDFVRSEAAVTIITVQEVFNGWVAQLNQPKTDRERLLDQYHQFYRATELFRTIQILEFDGQAYDRYTQLVAQNPELRKKRIQQNVRIAAIALSNNATIVTRNRRDFELVPGLEIEDWSIGS